MESPNCNAGGAGDWPGIGTGGPEPGRPEPPGGPLLTPMAGAPAVVPMALACASVTVFGDGGAAGGGPAGRPGGGAGGAGGGPGGGAAPTGGGDGGMLKVME